MRLTVLGGGGGYPTPDRPCSGYLVEHDGFHLLVDPGHGTMSRLVEYVAPEDVDAALVTHDHADHCADLNPLLRARHLAADPPAALPIHAPSGALGSLLSLDGPMLVDDWTMTGLSRGQEALIGPFTVVPVELPHFVRNLAIRLSVGDRLLAYTGDAGASAESVDLARGADVLLAEASFVDEVPEESADGLSSARDRGALAAEAGVGRLVLCHVWPGASPDRLEQAARRGFSGGIAVAYPGLTMEI